MSRASSRGPSLRQCPGYRMNWTAFVTGSCNSAYCLLLGIASSVANTCSRTKQRVNVALERNKDRPMMDSGEERRGRRRVAAALPVVLWQRAAAQRWAEVGAPSPTGPGLTGTLPCFGPPPGTCAGQVHGHRNGILIYVCTQTNAHIHTHISISL